MKTSKSSTKKMSRAKVIQSVSARKVLKNGEPSSKAKKFKSLSEASAWIQDQGCVKGTTETAYKNIHAALIGHQGEGHPRYTAYGYVWEK